MRKIAIFIIFTIFNISLWAGLRFLNKEVRVDKGEYEAFFPELKISQGLFYMVYQIKKDDGVYIMFTKSSDFKNWSNPIEINTGYPVSSYSDYPTFSWDVNGEKIVISWIYTFDVYNCPYYTTYHVPRPFFRTSIDGGNTWGGIEYIDDVENRDDFHDDFGVRVVAGEDAFYMMIHEIIWGDDIIFKRFNKISYDGRVLSKKDKFQKHDYYPNPTDLMFGVFSKKSRKAYFTLTEGYLDGYLVSYTPKELKIIYKLAGDTGGRVQRARDLKMDNDRGVVYFAWEDINYMSDRNVYVKLTVVSTENDSEEYTSSVSHDRESDKFGTTVGNFKDRVVVVWSDGRNGNYYERYDIYMNYSEDGGKSFKSEDIKVNNCESDALFPTVTVDNKAVFVAWTDYRDDTPNIYLNYSLDGGKNFLKEDIHITSLKKGNSREYYPVLFAKNGKLYIIWFDDRLGDFHIYSRIAVFDNSLWKKNAKICKQGLFGEYCLNEGIK